MSLVMSRRRRRWALLAATVAGVAGGYFTYRLYTSEAWRRRRQQVARLVGALSLLGDAAQEGAESAALISSDLKRFLLSDDDALPRSLRQALKITRSSDFQHSCTLISAALTRGLLRGFASPPPPPSPPLNPNRSSIPPEDLTCKEIKEICLISCLDSSGSQKGRVHFSDENERGWRELKSCTTGSKRVGQTVETDARRQQQREGKPPEELPERLLGKLFSEPGVNFASAVVGNLACNIVKALFDGFESQNVTRTNGGEPNFCEPAEGEKAASSKVVDVLCTQQCRGLIAECIQTLVSTTVSVYVDKTKDVNFYDEMVAGITNPSHKDPMKDLLTTICNGAVETLVKSSHNVMFAKKSGQPGSDLSQQYPQQEQWAVEDLSNGPHVQSQLSLCTPALNVSRRIQCQGMMKNVDDHVCTSSCSLEVCELSAPPISKPNMFGILQSPEGQTFGEMSQRPQRDNNDVQSLIDGVSKTLAIPSNHKLVVDVAGTMTSEAVRSFVDVVVGTVSRNLHDKIKGGWGRLKLGASEQIGNVRALQCQAKYKDMAIKAFFLASICLAICLHMLTSLQIIQKM